MLKQSPNLGMTDITDRSGFSNITSEILASDSNDDSEDDVWATVFLLLLQVSLPVSTE